MILECMRLGDIDVAGEIIELHYQVARTQFILDCVMNFGGKPLVSDIDKKALAIVQEKFPNMHIVMRDGKRKFKHRIPLMTAEDMMNVVLVIIVLSLIGTIVWSLIY